MTPRKRQVEGMTENSETTNPDVQKLAPRVLADVFIDGELKPDTLKRHDE